MKLGTRLTLLSALVLTLPLAGWQLVRSLEGSLRDSYQHTLIDTARSVAEALATLPVELPAGPGFYVHAAESEIVVDGHSNDWTPWPEEAQALPALGPDSGRARVVLAERRGRLHVLVEVDDPELALTTPGDEPGDRVELEVVTQQGRGRVTVAPMAPGWFSTPSNAGWPRAQAALQPRESGWTLEIALASPTEQVSELGLRIIDVDRQGESPSTTVHASDGPRTLIRRSAAFEQRLATLLPERTRGWVTGPDGWILARAVKPRPRPETRATRPAGCWRPRRRDCLAFCRPLPPAAVTTATVSTTANSGASRLPTGTSFPPATAS